MTASHDKALVRRRHHARLGMLKRRTAVASVLGFAALLGLVTQHAVKGASGATAVQHSSAGASSARSFFDEGGDGFSFGEDSTAEESAPSQQSTPLQQSAPPATATQPPVAQSSVS
jgi:hypothetical protein